MLYQSENYMQAIFCNTIGKLYASRLQSLSNVVGKQAAERFRYYSRRS